MPPARARTAVSLKDIAQAADVSVSAVSLALRNFPAVSEAERTRIQGIATRLGYRPNPHVAQLMAQLRSSHAYRKPSRLALVIPGYPKGPDRKINLMIEGARKRADAYGYAIEEFWPLEAPTMNFARLRDVLQSRGIRGLLLGPMRRGDAHLDFDVSGFSAVAMGYSMCRPAVHRAVPHHFKMMRGLLQEVLRLGFKRIGLVLWERMETGFNHLLSAAYFQMQHQLAREHRLEILHASSDDAEVGISVGELERWVERERPELILGPATILKMLKTLGHEVPGEVSFVSLDLGDAPHDIAGLIGRYDLVGAAAVDLLVNQLNLNLVGVPDEPKVVMVDSSWQMGSTVVAPATAKPRRKAHRR